jgi:HAE1 family hydrophobic/amphiphilic exporter-1
MGLTRIAILRPLFTTMVFLAIAVVGLVAYRRLGVDLWPALNIPVVTVTVVYPGASPETVEQQVTRPIEDALSGLPNLDYLASTSTEGLALVTVVFTERADPDAAAIDVERRISAIRATLPSDIRPPSVGKFDLQALPVMTLAVSGDRPPDQIATLVEEQVRPRLSSVAGVAQVTTVGGLEREIRVEVDPARLWAYNLSLLQVVQALQQEHLTLPGGTLTQPGRAYSLRLNAEAATPEQIASLIIAQRPGGPLLLRDVATVTDTFKERTQISRADGRTAVGILVTKQATANTLEVTDGVKRALRELQATLPADVRLDITTDASVYIRRALEGVQRSLIEAILLTGLVLLVFLHTWRSTVIVLLAIPTSLVATFGVMYLLGFTLNTMSLLALALSIGILVDDSIVVLENIYRHLQGGENPFTAALRGRSEIGLAAIAITLVDVVVFTPVAFITGLVGQYFRQFGLVVATATLFSLLVSFTLTPMLAARWLRVEAEARGLLARFGQVWEAGYARLVRVYRLALGWSLGHRWLVIGGGVLSFLAGLGLVVFNLLPSEFLPSSDEGEFVITVELPAGTPLAETDRAVQAIEAKAARWPEVQHLFTTVGVGSGFQANSRVGQVRVKLVPKSERRRPLQSFLEEARTFGADLPGVTVRAQSVVFVGPGGQPIQVWIQGEDSRVLHDLATRVEAIVRSVPGTTDITNSSQAGQPEVVVRLDRSRAADLGLTASQVGQTLRTAVAGTVAARFRTPDGPTVDIRVVAQGGDRQSPEQVAQLPLLTSRGTMVRLGQVATVETASGPPEITRRDRQRLVTVGAALSGRALGDVSRELQEKLAHLPLPPGYRISLGGATQAQAESFAQLFQALGLSVLLIYMLLVALYESLLYPFIIMLSLPLAGIGALGALWVTGNTLNMVSLIGIIMLTGLVGKNAILLVDYTNTLRRRGLTRAAALLEAGPTRLRPILMTTVSMIAAMLPVALSRSEGAETRAPMAITLIGGLLTSTLLTLLFIPAVYTVFDDLQEWLRRRLGLTAGPAPAAWRDERQPALPMVEGDGEVGGERAW